MPSVAAGRCAIIMASNKVQMSDTDTLKLIKEVKKRGCIWNPDDEDYSERHHLSVAWDDITKALDLPEDIIRAKWKVLRDFFKREVKKKHVNAVEEYKGRWRHFRDLGFLLRPGTEEEEEQTDSVKVKAVKVKPERDEPKYAPDSNSNFEVYIEDPIPEKRHKTDDDGDYNMMFLKSLKPFFDQLEPTRNLVVRSRVQDMLLNEIAAQNMNKNK